MKAKFLHLADCHLGYDQYNLPERYNDFTRAFLAIINQAIAQQVDFVILAGDLFHKRSIDALTLNQAMRVLERLRQAGIPCIAVEGNHEKAYLQDHLNLSWMDFLARQELVTLLSPTFGEEDPIPLQPYRNHQGAYVDPIPGLRVFGLKYMGASTAKAMERVATAMQAMADEQTKGIEYTIFVAHTGIEGVMPGQSGGLSHRQLAPLRPHVDYLALGHIHKPFSHEEWVYNPGSPETCSLTEAAWDERGYYVVEVDTDRARSPEEPAHTARLYRNPRRPVHRLAIKTDLHPTPEALMTFADTYVARRARDLLRGGEPPVVELQLFGNLPFDRSALDLAALKTLLDRHFTPLISLVKNQTQPTEFAVDLEQGVSRLQLERQILAGLFQRDERFGRQEEAWADLAMTLKRLALENSDPETILTELESRSQQILTAQGER